MNEQFDLLPKLSAIDSMIMMYDLYEARFGIRDHFNRLTKSPLSSVEVSPVEDINTGSLLQESIRLYLEKNIHQLTGWSFTEYMDCPPDVVAMVNEEIDAFSKKKSKQLDEIKKSLGDPGKDFEF